MIKQKGFFTLITALIVIAIGLSVSISLLLLGLGTSKTSLSIIQLYQAKSLANACAEEALEQIQSSGGSYTGTATLSMGLGTCSYTVSGTAPNKTIDSSGSVGGTLRKVKVVTSSATPQVSISSWQDVADF